MIEKKFIDTFTVKRQAWTTEIVGDKTIDKAEETVVSTFLGYRQQATAAYIQSIGLQISKPHVVWCPLTMNVVEGDILSSTYGIDRVRSVQKNRDGINAHTELLVEFIGEEIESGSGSESE